MKIASRMSKIQPSLTLAVAAKAAALVAKGVDVVAFGVGEPDFDTPASIKDAAISALGRGVGKYTAVTGTPQLRAAVADELNRIHGTKHTVDTVIVSVGAKHSLYNLFMALLDDGDEVIIPAPCWVSYPELVSIAGGTPVLLRTSPDDSYKIDEAMLAKLVTPRTRAILLNSPCNPTGAVYDADTLKAVARVVAENPELLVISDDIYRRLVYGVQWHSIAKLAPEIADRVVLIDGVSKSYAMTGWRIGYCAGPKELIAAMGTLQGQSTSNPSAVSQAAALEAITGQQISVEDMRVEFDRRRKVMITKLREIPDVKLSAPQGAFYCFPDLSAYVGGKIKDDIALCEWLLEHGRVALVPGSGFFAPGFARLSYATSLKNVEEGVARIAAGLKDLREGK